MELPLQNRPDRTIFTNERSPMFDFWESQSSSLSQSCGERRACPDALWVITHTTGLHGNAINFKSPMGKMACQPGFVPEYAQPTSHALLRLPLGGGDPIEAWERGPTCPELVIVVREVTSEGQQWE